MLKKGKFRVADASKINKSGGNPAKKVNWRDKKVNGKGSGWNFYFGQ